MFCTQINNISYMYKFMKTVYPCPEDDVIKSSIRSILTFLDKITKFKLIIASLALSKVLVV